MRVGQSRSAQCSPTIDYRLEEPRVEEARRFAGSRHSDTSNSADAT